MSHEIRTPMHGVLGLAALLRDTALTPGQQEYVATIQTSAERLLAVINDILDFSKMESGNLQVEAIPFDLAACLNETMRMSLVRASEKGLRLTHRLNAGVPSIIVGDPTRLRQILVNLIGNGLKFTSKGEVALSVSVHDRAGDSYELVFAVKDTGIGISPERQDRLFQSFSQGDASTARQYGGTGLGLAICKRLSQLMGGTCWFDSKEGEGSTFYFTIVTRAAALSVPIDLTEVTDAEPAAVTPRLRVLLADDNPVNQLLTKRMLERLGHVTQVVGNGLEALNALKSSVFDVVLMDAQMPILDGFAATRQIRRQLPRARQPYIIATTANAMTGDRERCLDAGMDSYLSKPFGISELANVLARVEMLAESDADPSCSEPESTPPTEPESEVPTLPPPQLDVPVLDTERLESLRQLEQLTQPGLVRRLIDSFLQDSARHLQALHRAVEDGNREALRSIAHNIKGSSMNLGAVALAQLCESLEYWTFEARPGALPILLQQLDHQWVLTQTALLVEREQDLGIPLNA